MSERASEKKGRNINVGTAQSIALSMKLRPGDDGQDNQDSRHATAAGSSRGLNLLSKFSVCCLCDCRFKIHGYISKDMVKLCHFS